MNKERMKDVVAIDPGNRESAYTHLRLTDDLEVEILEFCKCGNLQMRRFLESLPRKEREVYVAIEMVASYGMPVGADVFETCVVIGEFKEVCRTRVACDLIFRKEVKMWHCGTPRANDANITTRLVDKYGDRERHGKHGKGVKSDPGFFHGFKKDIWQAFALGSYVIENGVINGAENKLRPELD